MKDENGIEIKCENCDVNAQRDCNLGNAERGRAGSNGCRWYFYPSYRAYEARIAELQTELNVIQESECVEAQEADRLREEVKELKRENALLKDGKSHIMDVKMSPELIKQTIGAVNSEVEILKKELCFTDEELDLIRKYLQEQIWEYKEGWSSVKKIIAKCTELLKERNK